MIKALLLFPVGLFVFTLVVYSAFGGELKAGKAKAQTVCQTCHGMDGIATQAMVPNLAGQQKEYIIKQLKEFRSWQRVHAQMSIIAKMLKDEDIENVAEWFSSIKISVQLPE